MKQSDGTSKNLLSEVTESQASIEFDKVEIPHKKINKKLGLSDAMSNFATKPKFIQQIIQTTSKSIKTFDETDLKISTRVIPRKTVSNKNKIFFQIESIESIKVTDGNTVESYEQKNIGTVEKLSKSARDVLKNTSSNGGIQSGTDSQNTKTLKNSGVSGLSSDNEVSGKIRKSKKHIKKSRLSIGFHKNSINLNPQDRAINLIRDKAFNLYGDEVIEMKKRNNKTPKNQALFTKILRKHFLDKPSFQKPSFINLITKMKGHGKGSIQKINNSFEISGKFLKQKILLTSQLIGSLLRPIHPYGLPLLIWEFVITIVVSIDLVLMPFILAFENDLNDNIEIVNTIQSIQSILLLLDVARNFHTGYYMNGNLIFSHKKIFKHYFLGFFWVDFMLSFPFQWIRQLEAQSNTDTSHQDIQAYISFDPFKLMLFIRILRVFKVFKFKALRRRLQQNDYLSPVLMSLLSLFKLSLIISCLAHWCACIWYLIGSTNLSYNWLQNTELQNQSLAEKYVASLYFAITTMLTVGYGDINPINLRERVFAIFLMILGGGMFGYTMNSIANIVQSLEGEKSRKLKKLKAMVYYMERKGLNQVLQERVIQYIKFSIENDDGRRQEDEELLSMLSNSLREEIFKQINGKFITENIVFQKMLTKNLKDVLHIHLEDRIYSPDENIFSVEDSELSFYFISKGKVELSYVNFKRSLDQLNKNGYFGQVSFFTGFPREIMAQSKEFSHLIYISRSKFLELLENYPTDKEAFASIKDKINLYQNYLDLQIKCSVCDDVIHIVNQCPKIHYIPIKEDVIRSYLREEKNFQRNFKRKSPTRFNARISYKVLVDRVNLIQQNFGLKKPKKQNIFREFEKTLSQSLDEIKEEDDEIPIFNNNPDNLDKNLLAPKATNFPDMVATFASLDFSTKRKHYQLNHYNSMGLEENNEEQIIFDKVKNYEVYFPHNNLNKVLEIMSKIMKNSKSQFGKLHKKASIVSQFNQLLNTKKKRISRSLSLSRKVSMWSPLHGKVAEIALSKKPVPKQLTKT